MCNGWRQQTKVDNNGQPLVASVDQGEDAHKEPQERQHQCRIVEEEDFGLEVARDDVSGVEPNPHAAKQARIEGIQYVWKMNFYTTVPIYECYQVTKKAPIFVRWVDISKGDNERPNVRPGLSHAR